MQSTLCTVYSLNTRCNTTPSTRQEWPPRAELLSATREGLPPLRHSRGRQRATHRPAEGTCLDPVLIVSRTTRRSAQSQSRSRQERERERPHHDGVEATALLGQVKKGLRSAVVVQNKKYSTYRDGRRYIHSRLVRRRTRAKEDADPGARSITSGRDAQCR